MTNKMETALRNQEGSILSDPQKEHKIDYASNEQSKTIITSYLVGDVQTQLASQTAGALRGWNGLDMNILDIPLWQLMGSKEYKNKNGLNITKPKIADYAWCKLNGFEITFKDMSLSCINNDNSTNSYQTIHDPIIQIRKRARGIDATYIADDWKGVAGFYDEDYGDSIDVHNGTCSFRFNTSGQYVRTPKNILQNIYDLAKINNFIPMRLGDLLYPVICPTSRIFFNSETEKGIERGNLRNIQKYNRLPFDALGSKPNYWQNVYIRRMPTTNTIQGTFDTIADFSNYGANMLMRMGQWPTSTNDYALDIRVRNLPRITEATKNIIWILNYNIELKATWECKLYEHVNLNPEILIIPNEQLKYMRNDPRWGWLNKIIKIAAGAFIDWLVPIKNNNKEKEDLNETIDFTELKKEINDSLKKK